MSMETLPIWSRQETFREFRAVYEEERKPGGEILIFGGSGLSINAGLPNWPGLLALLASRWEATNVGSKSRPKLVEVQKLIRDREYPAAGNVIRRLYRNDHSLRQALKNILQAEPTALHQSLAGLPWQRIVTTNYDSLIETACKRKDVPASVLAPYTRGAVKLESLKERLIYKIHGDIADEESVIVIGKDDYDRMYVGDPDAGVRLALRNLIRRSRLILFIGYGHRDQYIQDVWKFARVGLAEVKNAFALVPIEGMPDEFEANLASLDAVGVRFIGYSVHDNYSELLQFLQYLEDPTAGDLEFARIASAKRPTVVMVYCGGTIGADDTERVDEKLTVSHQPTRYGLKLENLKRELKNWYGDFYNAGHDLQLEIEWEILPVEWQIFSENATPEYWSVLEQKVQHTIFKYMVGEELIGRGGVLMPEELLELYRAEKAQHALAHGNDAGFRPLDEKQFIIDISNRFILGIVMLVGTDTLAYSAAALSCGLQYLPCPVVITGANQPPSERKLSVRQRSRFFVSSDAWRNLMTAMYFLQTFGYSLTEVFVCFGDTIHHSVNLRKVSAENLGPGADVRRGGEREPFTFRNLTFRSQYMFKMIDGMFCNNYYPRDSLSFAAFVGRDSHKFRDLRHVREDLFSTNAEDLRIESPSSLVWHMKASPAFPRVSLKGLPSELLPRIVLVEGYVSGTYPSSDQSYFSLLIKELHRRRIPLFLTAPYGIQGTQLEYKTDEFVGIDLDESVSQLYGVIEETALPLLAHVVGRIPSEQWSTARNVKERLRLISQKIDEYFVDRPNILTREFIGVTEPDKQVDRHETLASEARSVDRPSFEWNPRFAVFEGLRRRLLSREETVPPFGAQHVRLTSEDPVTLTRGGFFSTVEQVVRPYQQIGAGPDGFSTLSRVGFEVGLNLVRGNWENDLQLDSGERTCTTVLRSIAELFAESGIVDGSIPKEVQFQPWESEPADPRSLFASFHFPLTIRRYDHTEVRHEKYAVASFSPKQQQLWEMLRTGFPAAKSRSEHERLVASLYRDILERRWQNRLSSVEWAVVGVFKGAACGIADALRFGSLAREGAGHSRRHADTLGQAVKIHLIDGSRQEVRLSFTYNASNSDPDDAAD
jgi:hypothetical protein